MLDRELAWYVFLVGLVFLLIALVLHGGVGMLEDLGNTVRNSQAYYWWKGLQPVWRMVLAAVAVFAVVAVGMLIATYWDVPQVPSPSGEGG